MIKETTMKVNIWSDIRCPFCYIGKHKFEQALEQFPHKDQITVTWRSFELDPDLKTQPGISTLDYLAASKMISRARAEEMTRYAAQETGIRLDFQKAVVANTFKAHCLIQLAQTKGVGSVAEENLFRAHFTEGENIDDEETLLRIATTIGLDPKETTDALHSDTYARMVRKDEEDARMMGIRGVPYFVFNNQYAVSGAQPEAVFLNALQQSWNAFEQQSRPVILNEGASCSTDGHCA